MPVKYKIKKFVAGGVYHIYNKGWEGRTVFTNETDFRDFEEQLAKYLMTVKVEPDGRYKSERPYRLKHKQEMNLAGQVTLLAYCLMPTHFHLVIQQQTETGLTQLMRRMLTNFVMRYNQRHNRSGPLFEGVYKAVLINKPEQVVAVTRMVHLNPGSRTIKRFGPVETVTAGSIEQYAYSSFRDYMGIENRDWVERNWVLNLRPDYVTWVKQGRGETEGVEKEYILD